MLVVCNIEEDDGTIYLPATSVPEDVVPNRQGHSRVHVEVLACEILILVR